MKPHFNKSSLGIVITLLILLCIGAIITYQVMRTSWQNAPSDASRALRGSATSTADYTDLQGNPVTLSNYKGHVVVANVWASWSPFSATELSELQTIAQHYTDRGVVVLGINRKEEVPQVSRYTQTLPTVSAITFVIDRTDLFYRSVGGYAMPETIIFDTSGKVAYHIRGVLNPDEVKQDIELLLK